MSVLDIDLPDDHVARTLTCDIKIALQPQSDEPLITDCGFLRANKAAEELYGTSLTYRYKSQFRTSDATRHAQCRMIASEQGQKDYNSSSLNYLLRANGEGVWVRQDVVTYHEDSLTYWLTALYVSSQPGVANTCNLNDYGVTLADLQATCGLYTIADLQGLPANLTSALALSTIIPAGVKICKIKGQSSVWVGSVGAFLGRFLHACQACGVLWASHNAKPKRCTRRGLVPNDASCNAVGWWHA